MKHLVALSDQKYLPYGLALIESLQITSRVPWTLHYYCIDSATYQALVRLAIPNVHPYSPQTLTFAPLSRPSSVEVRLSALREQNFQEFCWTVASVFTHYVMTSTPGCDSVTYIDSDICFYKDIGRLFSKFGDKHCGIFRHRHFDLDKDYVEGHYNVGVVYFRNSTLGRRLLSWWMNAVLTRTPAKYATCGDQKFLEFFPTICAPSELYVDEGIGHGASWQWEIYDLSRLSDGIVIWNGEEQELVFNHFSRFHYDLDTLTFSSGWFKSDSTLWNTPAWVELHTQYVHALKRAHDRLRK
jgi:hypothetical protein